MKTITTLLIIVLILCTLRVYSQNDSIITFGEEIEEVEYYFGFNLIPSAMGGLIHLALIKPSESNKYIIKQITKVDFIAQASGKQKSLANPKSTDLFKEYQIDNPNIVDDLWRLRYKEYPYFSTENMQPGWSVNDSIPILPSLTQMKTLEKFGLYRINDYIYGDNAFKLLYLISKPEWVNTYKESY